MGISLHHARSSQAVVFRRLCPADACAVRELEERCFSLPWTEQQCRSAFSQPSFAAFGLCRCRRLIAYISVYHVADEFEILNLGVLPEERRKGMGLRLLRTALQVARKMNMQEVRLEVRAGNLAAIALYRACGFSPVGRRPRYYPDTGEDALIYGCRP